MSASRTWPILWAVALPLAACDTVQLTEAATARVRVESREGVSVRLLTSTDFLVVRDEFGVLHVELFAADSGWYPVPYDESFDIRQTRRFLVRALESDSADATVSMSVWIDGEERFQSTQLLAEQILDFMFISN